MEEVQYNFFIICRHELFQDTNVYKILIENKRKELDIPFFIAKYHKECMPYQISLTFESFISMLNIFLKPRFSNELEMSFLNSYKNYKTKGFQIDRMKDFKGSKSTIVKSSGIIPWLYFYRKDIEKAEEILEKYMNEILEG
jgi:hypothetical protein